MKQSDPVALEHLKAKISPFMLRRTKGEVLKELPPKIEQTIDIELSDEQNILYQNVLSQVRKDIFGVVEQKGFKSAQIHILAGLTKLRQICNHPALVLPKKTKEEYPSAKLDVALNLIRDIRAQHSKFLTSSQVSFWNKSSLDPTILSKRFCFLFWSKTILSSIVPVVRSLYTFTVFFCPMRCVRSIA